MRGRALGKVVGWSFAVVAGSLLPGAPASAGEPTYRVRGDNTAPLDADEGWAGEEGEPVAVEADRPFRLRFECPGGAHSGPVRLEVRRNGGDWQTLEPHDFPYPTREFEVPLDPAAEAWMPLLGSRASLIAGRTAEDPTLRVRGAHEGFLAQLAPPWPAAEDVALAARFRLPARGDAIAFVWGLADAQNYYAARISAAGDITVIRVVEGFESAVVQARAPIARGAWHEAEIEVERGRLALAIDDRNVLTAEVEPTRGHPGLAVAPRQQVELAAFEVEGVARAPAVSIVSTSGYANGARTGDLIGGSDTPFVPGTGVSLWDEVRVDLPAGSHTETEWPLVIRRLADGPTVSESGDRFAFRLVRASDGAPVSPEAEVELIVPPGHLGGTFVETPGRIGPFQAASGDLYFIMEPAETDNKFMIMKSADGGRSWREVDGGNRPATGDLEAVDARLVGDRIVILHQVTNSVRYHTFRTSDHTAAPDRWDLRDEVAAEARAVAQMATIAPRSDGSAVAVFLSDRLHYAIRSPAGAWSAPIALDPGDPFINAGPQAVTGADDSVHLAYFTDDGRIWYRRLAPDGGLGERILLAEGAGTGRKVYGAVLPLAYDPASDTVSVAYRLDDGSLWERHVTPTGALSEARRIARGPIVSDAVDSQQAGADLVSTPGGALAVFIDEASGSIRSAREAGEGWSDPVPVVTGIDGAWVRGAIITSEDGRMVYGFVHDAGSKGGTGMNRYAEIELARD